MGPKLFRHCFESIQQLQVLQDWMRLKQFEKITKILQDLVLKMTANCYSSFALKLIKHCKASFRKMLLLIDQ